MSCSSNYSPSQEIRFAVVLYGGVSLAIYMNGIVQELLRMVRGTADLPAGEKLKGTERVYREIGQLLRPDRIARESEDELVDVDPEDLSKHPIQTRFVVDIISGSSAGGINGVALAKALALKCRSMDILKNTWLEKAQIDSLLNDKRLSPLRKTASLLDSEHMYATIFDTLSAFNADAQRTQGAGAFADQIDLFVTATDLNGLYAPIQLADTMIEERVHRAVFHFEYVSPEAKEALGLECTPPDHFTQDYDPMLAFAARCTSSFPVAFEPMTFEKIEQAMRAQGRTLYEAEKRFGNFFSAYRAQGMDFQSSPDGEQTAKNSNEIPLEKRPFADGGYLDNRPFSYAIDLIQYRSATRPAQRKLLFVDPFPEFAEDNKRRTEIGFIDNAKLAAITLPRYETIRGDIDRINDNNRRQDRLDALRERVTDDENLMRDDLKIALRREPSPKNFQKLYVDDLFKEYGYIESYLPYHHLRVQSVTGDLALTLTRVCGFHPESDEEYFIRLVIRAWREARFKTLSKFGGETENAFLYRFDVDYRLRRLDHLVEFIDKHMYPPGSDPSRAAVSEDRLRQMRMLVERELARLREAYRKLGSRSRSPLLASVEGLSTALRPHFANVMGKSDRKQRYNEADKVYKQYRDRIDGLMEQVAEHYAKALADSSRAMSQLLKPSAELPLTISEAEVKLSEALYNEYYCFHWHDMLSLPFLDGSVAKENARIEVYRVSPAGSRLKPMSVDRSDKKLAGTAAADFGGFLQRAWRENDIMWGRLDGAERIITALLPGQENKSLRDRYIERAQQVILEEELSPKSSQSIFRWLAQRLRKDMGSDVTIEKIIRHGNEIFACFPPLKQIVSNAEFKTFVETYYEIPGPPSPAEVTEWSSRALKIFARMIDDLPESKSKEGFSHRLANPIRWSGVLLTQLATFATPGRLGWRLAEYWLSLLAVGAILLILVAPIVGVAGVAYVGYATLVGGLALWVVQHAFGRVLTRKSPLRDLAIVLAVLALLSLFAVGAVTVAGYILKHPFLWS